MRKTTAVFSTLCCVLCSVPAWGQHTVRGVVQDAKAEPVAGATVILRSLQDTLDCTGDVTDRNGRFMIGRIESGRYGLECSSIGYAVHRQELTVDRSIDVGEIVLEEAALTLDEVVVTASMVKRFADRKEYRLTDKEQEGYSSALSALEHLPKIQVVDHRVHLVDGKTVEILINGIPSTPADLAVIPPGNIAKIDYYTQPPIRYSNMGLGAVIDVATKERRNGGSVGFNAQNAVTTGFGNNVANFKYNRGRSQIGVTYGIDYRSYNKRILDEDVNYTTGGQAYRKQKSGKNSPYAYERQLAGISFSHSRPDSGLFRAELSFNSLNRRRSSGQEIISAVDGAMSEKFGESSDKDRYVSPVLDVYFSKTFRTRHELAMNLVGTCYRSDYAYRYSEHDGVGTDFETATAIHIDKYSLIGEAVYSCKTEQAQLYAGARYMYNNSAQKNLPQNNRILTHEIYAYLGIGGMLGKSFRYSVSAGVNGNICATTENREWRFAYFRPQVRLGYFIDERSELAFNYEVNTENPAVSALTDNPYYKDANYLFTGNPNLRPSNNHDLSLSYFRGFERFVLNAEVGYARAKDAIAPIFQSDGTKIIETFGNLDHAQHMKASLFLQWYPFPGNILRLRLYSEAFRQINRFGGVRWSHTGYSIIPSVHLACRRWGVSVFYQTERKSLAGQTTKSVPSMASAELSYSPAKNLTLAAGIRYPFYDSWRQTTSVSGTSLLRRAETERIIDNANMVYFNCVYNCSFGKSRPRITPKMQNKDKDSGVLDRY